MKSYKLKTGISETYRITTREDFEIQTKNTDKYVYIGTDGVKRGLAVCPSCDNPVRILGLFKPLSDKQPYAQHHNKSTQIAIFNSENYIHCPYSNPNAKQKFDISSKQNVPSDFEKELYYEMRDYFDKVIYLLNKKLDIYISYDFAQRLLMSFINCYGYCDCMATHYNLPWILMDSIQSFNLIGRGVKKQSKLWTFLSKRKDIELIPSVKKSDYDIVKTRTQNFVILKGCFFAHTRRIDENDNIDEKITFGVVDSEEVPANWIFKHKYSIDEFYFLNPCKSTDYRNQKLLDFAKELMPDL